MIDVVVIVCACFLFLWALIATYYCIKFARSLLNVTESIETALDILDERYASISQVLQIPIFYDSNEVRQVLQDIGDSRDAILQVALVMGHVEEVIDGDI